jgi:hypothetical protein
MGQDLVIHWREEAPHICAAQLVDGQGRSVYVGYVAEGHGHDLWRGDLGRTFTPVGMGSRATVQQVIEQQARGLLTQRSEKGAHGT